MRSAIGHVVLDHGDCPCVWHKPVAGTAAALSVDQVEAVLSVLVEITASTAGQRPPLPPTVVNLVDSALEGSPTDTDTGKAVFADFLSSLVALEEENVWVPPPAEDKAPGRRRRRVEQPYVRGSLTVVDEGLRYGTGTQTLTWAEIAVMLVEGGVRVSPTPRVGLHGTRVDWLEPGRDRIEPQPQWVNRTSTFFWPVDGLEFVHGRHSDAWAGATEFGERGPVWNRVLKRVETSTAIDGVPTVYVTRIPPFTPTFLDCNYAGARRVKGGQEIVARIRLDELSAVELGRAPHQLWFAGEAIEAKPRTAEFVKKLSDGWSPTSDVRLFRLIDGSVAYSTEAGIKTTTHFAVAVTSELPYRDTFRHADLIPTDDVGNPLGVLEAAGGSSVEQFQAARCTLRPGMSTDAAVSELLRRNKITTRKKV